MQTYTLNQLDMSTSSLSTFDPNVLWFWPCGEVKDFVAWSSWSLAVTVQKVSEFHALHMNVEHDLF